MGCNQTATASVGEARVAEIPCTAEEIGRFINDLRANPTKYADLL